MSIDYVYEKPDKSKSDINNYFFDGNLYVCLQRKITGRT